MGPHYIEWSPCEILICELEVQRKGRWDWEATIGGVVIRVLCNSSGHCDAWKERFKGPNYRALAEKTKAEKSKEEKKEEKAVDLESGTSGSSTAVGSCNKVDDTRVEGAKAKSKRGLFRFLT
jgi:hypothetical protein